MLAFLVFFAVFEGFEVAETIHDWSQDLDFLDIDDMILAAFLALASFAWFARRKLALRAAEHESDQYLLQTALDSMTDGIALFDKDERLVLWNEGFIRTSPALREIAARDITFTDLVARMSAKGRYLGVGADWVEKRVRQFRALESVENHMRDPDGRKRWAHVHLYRTRDGGTFLVRTDTTARKRVEAELNAVRRRLSEAIESIDEGIALFDKDERLELFNRRYAAEVAAIGDVFKPGLTFENMVRALARSGYYGAVDDKWIAERLRRFRALEEAEYAVSAVDGEPGWRTVRQFRTADGGTLIAVTDTTAQKRAAAELESSRHLLQDALESMTDGVALFDKDERLVLWNDSFVDNRPYLRGFIRPGLTFAEIIEYLDARGGYGDGGPQMVNARLASFRGLEPAEMSVRDPDGGKRWFRINHYRTREGGTFLVRADITARKRVEMDLAAAQQLLQTALDSINDGVALYDNNERLILYNEGYARSLALISDILKPGTTVTEEVEALNERGGYIDVGANWVEKRLQAFRSLEPIESHQRDKEGNERWISARHYRTREGGTFLVRADITARKRAEMELESSRSLLNTALETMTDGVSLYDKDEQLVLWNEEFLRFPAMMRDIVKPGLAFVDLIEYLAARGGYVGKDRAWIDERIRKFRALEPIEVVFRDKDGSERWFNMTHRRTRDGGTLVVREDITNRMRALSEIERARAIAESANEAKTKFLASMSHEVRTPLNAILGFTQMMELGLGKLPEAQSREYLAIILKSGQHLLDLVNQILEFAKIESQGDQKTFVPLSSADLARQSVDMVREEASRRKVALIDHVANTNADIRFLGDPLWVRQILINLLVNAVKYNRPGGMVALSVARGADGVVRFAVADTGSGIPRERHGHVFQPFQRLGREAGQIEGAGIGLALARQLALRMGGNIGFESEPGKGSTFWVELPAVADKVERVA